MAGKGSSDAVIRIPPNFYLYDIDLTTNEPKIVVSNTALRLKAVRDLMDENGDRRLAGDEWLFEGPGTYIPREEVIVEGIVCATNVLPNQAIRLRARKECTDRLGIFRARGEEWMIKKEGAYLPLAYEEVLEIMDVYELNEKKSLHVRSLKAFRDQYGVLRKKGEEWLIKSTDSKIHVPSVHEQVVTIVDITTLNNRQYCVILDPVDDKGNPQMGKKRLVKGEKSFFLQPGESLEKGIFILGEKEGLILEASEEFVDKDQEGKPVERKPGDKWMIRGSAEYIPPEITTNSQEATARHEAERLEQEAERKLERQKIGDEVDAEKACTRLMDLQASSAAAVDTGQAKAEAQSRAFTMKIEAETSLEEAGLKMKAQSIEWEGELRFLREQNVLEIGKQKQMAVIESSKFKEIVEVIGSQTLLAMATAGPDLQVKKQIDTSEIAKAFEAQMTMATPGSEVCVAGIHPCGSSGNADLVAQEQQIDLPLKVDTLGSSYKSKKHFQRYHERKSIHKAQKYAKKVKDASSSKLNCSYDWVEYRKSGKHCCVQKQHNPICQKRSLIRCGQTKEVLRHLDEPEPEYDSEDDSEDD